MDRDAGHQSITAHKCQGLEPRTEKKAIIEIFCGSGTKFCLDILQRVHTDWNDWSFLAFIKAVKWRRWRWKFGRKTTQLTEAKQNEVKSNDLNALIVGFSDDIILIRISSDSVYAKRGSTRRQMHRQVANIEYKVKFQPSMVRDAMRVYGSLLYKKFHWWIKIEWLWRISNVCLAVSPVWCTHTPIGRLANVSILCEPKIVFSISSIRSAFWDFCFLGRP